MIPENTVEPVVDVTFSLTDKVGRESTVVVEMQLDLSKGEVVSCSLD